MIKKVKIGLKPRLASLEKLISSFEKIVKDYPLADTYKNSLAALRTERANLVSQIGKNK